MGTLNRERYPLAKLSFYAAYGYSIEENEALLQTLARRRGESRSRALQSLSHWIEAARDCSARGGQFGTSRSTQLNRTPSIFVSWLLRDFDFPTLYQTEMAIERLRDLGRTISDDIDIRPSNWPATLPWDNPPHLSDGASRLEFVARCANAVRRNGIVWLSKDPYRAGAGRKTPGEALDILDHIATLTNRVDANVRVYSRHLNEVDELRRRCA